MQKYLIGVFFQQLKTVSRVTMEQPWAVFWEIGRAGML